MYSKDAGKDQMLMTMERALTTTSAARSASAQKSI